MNNPEKLARQGTQDEDKQNTICVGRHKQTNTNNVYPRSDELEIFVQHLLRYSNLQPMCKKKEKESNHSNQFFVGLCFICVVCFISGVPRL